METHPNTKHGDSGGDLRTALAFAGLMLVVSLGAKLGTRFGWLDAAEFANRSLMVILAAFIMVTGNAVPKRLAPLTGFPENSARSQAFRRFAGWTWVLAGLGLALAWMLLPLGAANAATLILMPAAIAFIAYRCWSLRREARQAALTAREAS